MSLTKSLYSLRSRIRFARYNSRYYSRYYHKSINLFQHNPHPVTLGPEQLSRFFTFVAHTERI